MDHGLNMKRPIKNPNRIFQFELYINAKVKDENMINAVKKIRKIIKNIRHKDILIEEVELLE